MSLTVRLNLKGNAYEETRSRNLQLEILNVYHENAYRQLKNKWGGAKLLCRCEERLRRKRYVGTSRGPWDKKRQFFLPAPRVLSERRRPDIHGGINHQNPRPCLWPFSQQPPTCSPSAKSDNRPPKQKLEPTPLCLRACDPHHHDSNCKNHNNDYQQHHHD